MRSEICGAKLVEECYPSFRIVAAEFLGTARDTLSYTLDIADLAKANWEVECGSFASNKGN